MSATGDSRPLPEDLIIEILLRLPVKSLLRFRSVCHLWNTTIRSPSFIKKHVHTQSSRTGLLVYWSGQDRYSQVGGGLDFDEFFMFDLVSAFTLLPDETLGHNEDLNHPEQFTGSIFSLLGPCNGIFCVGYGYHKLALWNPATRSFRCLPHYPNIILYDVGFWIDPLTDDFKVVLVTKLLSSSEFAIYNSNFDSWGHHQHEALADLRSFKAERLGSTFSNCGFFYWIRLNMRTRKSVILAFDMDNEVFQEIDLPEISGRYVERKVDWFSDSLALIANHLDEHIDLWIMKEQGSWTKLFTVCLPIATYVSIGIWSRNEIFASTPERELILFDLNSPKRRYQQFRSIGNAMTLDLHAFKYKESLVSV